MSCERCGEAFEANTSHGGLARRFCSDRCRKGAHDKRVRPKRERGNHKIATFERPFNAFDGEGESPNGDDSAARFVLLAAGDGRELYHADRRRLTTVECLEFLLDSPKQRNNVWFGFGYDVVNILYDLPRGVAPGQTVKEAQRAGKGEYRRSLARLQHENRTFWNGYRISWIPGKDFSVTKRERGCKCRTQTGKRSLTCEHYRTFDSTDVLGFFQTSFEKTTDQWYTDLPMDVRDIIARGKAARGAFHTWDLADVRLYNRAECKILIEIMSRFRDALRDSGQSVRRWNGAGAIAGDWLRRHNATAFHAAVPPKMDLALRCSFSGGRIDTAVIGSSRCSEGDIQSAYPAQARFVPDMSALQWIHQKRTTLPRTQHGLAHVTWDVDEGVRWPPFPFRDEDYSIKYPLEGEGWYHFEEVRAALLLFPNEIKISETWSPLGTESYPLREAIERDFAKRKAYKDAGHPANVPIKLALNSIYGKCAQRAGAKIKCSVHKRGNCPSSCDVGEWQEPRFFNLFWAGYITAATRARITDAIRVHGDKNVLAIATDGVFVAGKWKMMEPDGLGNYEVDAKTYRITTIGAGLYETRTRAGKVNKNKRRGHGGAPVPYGDIIAWWARMDKAVPWSRIGRRMVTIGKAVQSETAFALRGTFEEGPRVFHPPARSATIAKRYVPIFSRIKKRGLTELAPGERIHQGCSMPYRTQRPEHLNPLRRTNDDDDREY